MRIWIKNLLRVLYFGWRESTIISHKDNVSKSRFSIFIDMICCYGKYQLLSSQYRECEFYNLNADDKKKKGNELKVQNIQRDNWEKLYLQNWCFINRYSSVKWSTSSYRRAKRNHAYTKRFNLGKYCNVQSGVTFICEHLRVGSIKVGDRVLFSRECDIDYTGDLTIGRNVLLSESVKILTHEHSINENHDVFLTPLVIQDEVRIGVRAIILPGVKEIGRGAVIGAGAIVKHSVPPYSIVMGNPSKVVGFRFTPEQVIEYEKANYPLEERLPLVLLESNYEKYFLKRLKDIKEFTRI